MWIHSYRPLRDQTKHIRRCSGQPSQPASPRGPQLRVSRRSPRQPAGSQTGPCVCVCVSAEKSQIQGCRSPVCLDATAPLPTRDRYLPPSGEAGLCPCISLQLSTICLRSGTLDLIRSTQSPLLQTVPPELQKAILSHKSPSQSPTALNATNGTTGRILSYPKSRRDAVI